jgi:predicted RND superfamily exporter protein
VETSASLATLIRRVMVGLNEGNVLWSDLVRNQQGLNSVTGQAPRGLYNENCSLLPMYVFLKDHKADTLMRATAAVTDFAARNDTADVKFLLGAGNAGFEAATNEVVAQSSRRMLLLVYGAVAVLCLLAFRSWRATLCALLPLALTSILAEALMVGLGIGVKVATLPVIALGVGIGVDYALYIMSIVLAGMRSGATLAEAYATSLRFTGRVVLFTGATLAIGVLTWAFSPIKFQADMGLLLAFMFLLNMLGSLTLLPALAHFLLRPRPVGEVGVDVAKPSAHLQAGI